MNNRISVSWSIQDAFSSFYPSKTMPLIQSQWLMPFMFPALRGKAPRYVLYTMF